MGELESLRAFAARHGVRIFFYSNEKGHAEAPHCHIVKPGKWEIKVMLDHEQQPEVKWTKHSRGPSGAFLRQLQQALAADRAAILMEWERRTAHDR